MDEKELKKLILPFILLVLLVLAFFVIKPIIVPIILGFILAYLFYPFYQYLAKKLNSKNISAAIVMILAVIIIVVPIILIIAFAGSKAIELYTSIVGFDAFPTIKRIFPWIIENQDISTEAQASLSYIKSGLSKWVLSSFQALIFKLPQIIFGAIIMLFTFFFSLISGADFKNYFSLFFPLPEKYSKKLYDRFYLVTNSVLYGQLIVGLAQGIISGLGYFILGVPNALLLTILTTIIGVIPVIGPWLVWIPIDIYLFAEGHTGTGMALLIYGLFIINWIDTILRPQVVSSRAKMNSAIALIGTIGGLYAFGIIGILLGPLILAYLILLVEIYRQRSLEESIVIKEDRPLEAIK